MCQCFVLLSKNLPEYGVAMHKLPTKSTNSAAVMAQSLLQNLLSFSDFLQLPISIPSGHHCFSFLSQTWRGNQKINFRDPGCQGTNYVCGTVLFPTYINIKFLKLMNQGWHPY